MNDNIFCNFEEVQFKDAHRVKLEKVK